jgi:hypothetical protein
MRVKQSMLLRSIGDNDTDPSEDKADGFTGVADLSKYPYDLWGMTDGWV